MLSPKVSPLLVAEERIGNTHVRIFRKVLYDFAPRTDLAKGIVDSDENTENGYNVLDIYRFMKTTTDQVVPDLPRGDVSGLLSNLHYIQELYTETTKVLTILQSRLPGVLVKQYEMIEFLTNEIGEEIKYYLEFEMDDVLNRLWDVRRILQEAKKKIILFWRQIPEFFIRLPINITREFLSPQLFLSGDYFPYITGSPLPEWTDPDVIAAMNVALKIYHTKEQTIVQKRAYMLIVSLIFREKMANIPCEIKKIIIDYLPIFIVFNLFVPKTPLELANFCSATIYVS